MYTLDCIFVSRGINPELEKIIKTATGGNYAHSAVGVIIEGKYRIIESDIPAVHLSPGDEYDQLESKEIISLPITEEQRQAVVERAFELLGKVYGVDDCVEGGIEDIANQIKDGLGEVAGKFINKIIDVPESYDCSHVQIELVRAAFPDFAADVESTNVTPERARKMIINLYNKVSI